jgi:multidrug efflux pump subunit AcrB
MSEPSPGKLTKGPIRWMAGNSVASNLLMLVLLVGGFMAASRIKQEVFPEFALDIVSVTVPYPGASPDEVEKGIVKVIEEVVRGLDGVEEVSSSAQEGVGVVRAELIVGAAPQKLTQEIRQEIDRIRTFPEEAEEPSVVLMTQRRSVLSLVLYGDQDEAVLRELAEQVRDRLLTSPDITQVGLSGVRPLEISIEVSQENLRAYNLTLTQIAQRIRAAAVELPGGGIKTRGGEILVRMKERRDYGRQFEDIPIVTANDGTDVRLGDIATIVDGFEDVDRFATYDGKPAVMLNVYRVGEQTPIQVADAVREKLEEIKPDLPPGIDVDIRRDFSEFYSQRIDLLLRNGALGLALVLVMLALFLEVRLAFWVTMGIPISFLGSFLLLPVLGVTINMISLFAFIIALGIVVDDAIVVGENVYEYHQQGMPFWKAAVRGARDVALPVTFSILTNIAAFMPMFFVPGTTGKVFKTIPAVVVVVFTISLVECLFVLPAHLSHQRDRRNGILGWLHRGQQRFSGWIARMIRDGYGPFLDRVLRHRYVTLSIGAAVLSVTIGYIASGRMGMTLFPRVESDIAIATAVLPDGSSVKETETVRDRLLRAAKAVAEAHGGEDLVRGIFAEIGGGGGASGWAGGGGGVSGGHIVEVSIYLTPPEQRPIGTKGLVDLWRKQTGKVGGLDSLIFESDRGGPGSGAAITVELSHRDIDVLEIASTDLADALELFPEVKDVNDGFSPGKQQFDFKIRPEGQSLGLTAFEVARQVRSCFYGAEALRQQRGRNELKVMVRLPQSQRMSEYDLESLLIRTPAGREVPVHQAATSKRDRAYTVINRREGRRTVAVTADCSPPSKAGQIMEALKTGALPKLQTKHPGLQYGFEGKQADMKESMTSLMVGFGLAMLVIYALLAIPFRSYIQPAIIMVSIPFGIVGAVIGHLIMGYSLSIISMMGIVALAGVVVNDSLVLIDYANRQRKEGLSRHDAVHVAGVRRFRPILLTTLTTFGGLAPMIFETSRQARFLIPMALSLGYGILFATLISLLLVPCLFLIVEDIRHVFGLADPLARPADDED